MTCPFCNGRTHVIDSRHTEDSKFRRRECLDCKHRFSTYEIDADYYETLKPIDKKKVQKELQDGYETISKKLFEVMHIKVDEEKAFAEK